MSNNCFASTTNRKRISITDREVSVFVVLCFDVLLRGVGQFSDVLIFHDGINLYYSHVVHTTRFGDLAGPIVALHVENREVFS